LLNGTDLALKRFGSSGNELFEDASQYFPSASNTRFIITLRLNSLSASKCPPWLKLNSLKIKGSAKVI
jgi:hypothetical protein